MECQTSHVGICSNGYYGFQPLFTGGGGGASMHEEATLSNGHGLAESPAAAWQRKRQREEAGEGGGVESVSTLPGTAAKRVCPDLYHYKLQQATGLSLNPPAAVENGTSDVAIGTDSSMMVTDECEEGEPSDSQMGHSVEALHRENGHTSLGNVATLRASQLPPHTCCSIRTQLCTMSFQQSYNILSSSSQDCLRCLAGEPAPYLNTIQTVENLSKLY